MIYLIGGSPRCGKTILANKIAREKRISLVSTDALRQVVLNTIPKSTIKKKFPQEPIKGPDGKFLFEIYPPRYLLKAQITEAKTMWPGTKSFIEALIRSGQDYVI